MWMAILLKLQWVLIKCLLGRYRMNQPRHVHSDLPNAYAEPKSLFSLGWMDLDILPRETHTNCRDG